METSSRTGGEVAEPTKPARAPQLVRELADFLVELSIAMHKHAIYPPGHPLLKHAVDAVYRTLLELLATRQTLSIGVARRQLIIDGVATDSVHPLLGELAGKLHRHHIGALKFERGVQRDEMGDALSVIGLEPQRGEQPVGLRLEQVDRRWTNVKWFPLSYDRLELLDEDEDSANGAGAPGGRDSRAAQLWVGLARAAIAGEGATEPESDTMEPAAVAHAIDKHDREQAYDQVIVGYLLQIADEVRAAGPSEGSGLKRRISKLVGALQPETLQRLLTMGGDAVQRRRFVLDASQGMTVDAVVELVQAAAEAEGQTISHSLVRMLTKLASHATAADTRRGHAADGALRENVARLVNQWTLDDPNPAAYSAALERMSRGNGAYTPVQDDVVAAFPCEPDRLIGMSLDVNLVGPSVFRAAEAMIDAGALGALLDLLDASSEGGGAAAALWAHVLATEPLRALLSAARLDQLLAQRVVLRLRVNAVGPLLDALMATPEAARRERLLALLQLTGADAARSLAARLPSAAPALVQELLAALVRMAPLAPPTEARGFLAHAEPLVRREAARLLMGYDLTREGAMLVAVRDADARVVAAGLREAQEHCTPQVASTIRQRIERGELHDDNLRTAAVRAVCAAAMPGRADDDLVEWLARRVVRPASLLRRARLAPVSPELLAALGALSARWNDDPRAAQALRLARASTNGAVRVASLSQRPMVTPRSVSRSSPIQ